MSVAIEDLQLIRFEAALDLLRYKGLKKVSEGHLYLMEIEDVNEVLIAAGLPVIVPEEVNAKEINVINVNKEEEHNDTL